MLPSLHCRHKGDAWIGILAVAIAAAAPGDVTTRVRAWRADHELQILHELFAFVSIPNVASNKADIELSVSVPVDAAGTAGPPAALAGNGGVASLNVSSMVAIIGTALPSMSVGANSHCRAAATAAASRSGMDRTTRASLTFPRGSMVRSSATAPWTPSRSAGRTHSRD